MFNFLDEAESGEIVFDNHTSHMLMLGLVLYELERLIGIVRWALVSEVKKNIIFAVGFCRISPRNARGMEIFRQLGFYE